MIAIIECEMPVDRALPLSAGLVPETLYWSEVINPPPGVTSGMTTNAAPNDDGVPGARPHVVVHVFLQSDIYISIGTNPDATNPAARRWLRGGQSHRMVLPNGQRVAWSTV
ncbi:hypothetical protein V5F49_05050 [Xanthobacter sp. V3C-3]|uniref:hypothetical protein n=1 Tax=Xanthobacter lutulentifluminis TaxID=3119935 RepID=UPI00372C6890